MNVIPILFLIFVATCSGLMNQLRKFYQVKHGGGFLSVLVFSIVSCTVAAIIGWGIAGNIVFEPISFVLALLYGIASTVLSSLFICASGRGNVSVLCLYGALGVLVLPSVYGLIFLPEQNTFSVFKIIGYFLAFMCVAIDFISMLKKSSVKSDFLFKIFCITIFIGSGASLIIFNLKNQYCSWYSADAFVAEYMLISAVLSGILLICYILARKKSVKTQIKPMFSAKSIFLPVGYAALFFVSELLAALCTQKLAINVQAPLSFAFTLIITALLEYLFFKVKLTKTMLLQMVVAFLCSVCCVL